MVVSARAVGGVGRALVLELCMHLVEACEKQAAGQRRMHTSHPHSYLLPHPCLKPTHLAATAQQLVVDGDGGHQQGLSALLGGADGQQGDQVCGTLVAVELEGVGVVCLGVLVGRLEHCGWVVGGWALGRCTRAVGGRVQNGVRKQAAGQTRCLYALKQYK